MQFQDVLVNVVLPQADAEARQKQFEEAQRRLEEAKVAFFVCC